jgi:hypothetical protein
MWKIIHYSGKLIKVEITANEKSSSLSKHQHCMRFLASLGMTRRIIGKGGKIRRPKAALFSLSPKPQRQMSFRDLIFLKNTSNLNDSELVSK